MKRFQFRLDRFLELRRAEELKKLQELARELTRLEQERQRLQVFRTEQRNQLEDMRSSSSKPFSSWLRGHDWKYLGRLERITEYQQGRVHEQESTTEIARGQYVESHTRVKSLEKLREIKKGEWWGEQLHHEQRLLDDIPRPADINDSHEVSL